ncbi:MAG: ATP-grasp domain-containing protein [Syntrophorhabdaceae bacterium]
MKGTDKPQVLLITDFRGLIPQRIMHWDGYDLDILKKTLEQGGVEAKILGAHAVSFRENPTENRAAAIYASSQMPIYKQYLQDIIANLHFSGVRLYPGFDHMLAHEDKAFQAFRLQRTDIAAPRSSVFGDKMHAYEFLTKASYPLVGKTASGYASRGVQLIRDEAEGKAFVNRNMKHRVLQKGRNKLTRVWQRVFPPHPVLGLVIFQEYVPNLKGDWKVLIWGDNACGLHRENRPHDFRASGSGRITFVDVPTDVLDFAYRALEKLELPWGSFDIAYTDGQCLLLEYQAIHFGLTTAERGVHYYVRNAPGQWQKHIGKIQVETEMANIVLQDLTRKGLL